jgi:predicted Zn-dependent protease
MLLKKAIIYVNELTLSIFELDHVRAIFHDRVEKVFFTHLIGGLLIFLHGQQL